MYIALKSVAQALSKGDSPFHVLDSRLLEAEFTAVKDSHKLDIVALGYPPFPSISGLSFMEAFFRLTSRDTGNINDSLMIAVPYERKRGFVMSKQRSHLWWSKIGQAFPNLSICYVDVENGTVEEHGWDDTYD